MLLLAVSGVLLAGLVYALDAPSTIAPAGAGAAWSQFGHDATHTGSTTTATALSASTVDRLRPAFTTTVPGTVDGATVLAASVPTPARGPGPGGHDLP